MAYQSKDLSVIAYANGFTMWHYTTPDLAADVDSSGYFNEAAHMLRVGDLIVANVDTDGTLTTGLFAVTGNTNMVVDVADMSSLSATNTD
ncbi:hypothetical protein [Aestuariispira ectoiniformans]|uniref:hypothetical protein n=1 Tax=Aestuariispira ectoiniformans TaxID=2775080 RepID=UPI00223B91CB|nr:hypothetical protein [Aestuariispira ectoiniformans]